MTLFKRLCVSLSLLALISGCTLLHPRTSADGLTLIYSAAPYGDFQCLSIYTYGKQLLIVDGFAQTSHREAPVQTITATLYDPDNGLYIPVRMPENTPSCKDLTASSVAGASVGQTLRIYRLTQPTVRALFDNGAQVPRGIASVVQTAPPYWINGGRYQGSPILIDLGGLPGSGGPMIFTTLTDISNAEADQRVANALSQRAAPIAADQGTARATAQTPTQYLSPPPAQPPLEMDRWKERLSAQYREGDQVCTYSGNLFGTIQRITAARFRVYIVGQVRWTDGFFFSGSHPGTDATKLGNTGWFDRSDMAHCNFE